MPSPLLSMFHGLSALLTVVGVILLILWALKTLKPKELRYWGIVLVAVGFALCLLAYLTGFNHSKFRIRMMNVEKTEMMGMNHDPMSMSMTDMLDMLDGKTDDAFDKAFLEGMIPHHQGAVSMAQWAEESAKHPEIKNLARQIITSQQREIDQMRAWQRSWGYAQ